jgi:hypothetical protein
VCFGKAINRKADQAAAVVANVEGVETNRAGMKRREAERIAVVV